MTPLKVICVNISPYSGSGFLDIAVLREISFFILETAEPAFNHDVIGPAAFAVHALPNSIFLYEVNILPTRKLTALIGILRGIMYITKTFGTKNMSVFRKTIITYRLGD